MSEMSGEKVGCGLRDAEVFFLGGGEGRVLDQGAAGYIAHVDRAVIEGAEDETWLAGNWIGECVVSFFLRSGLLGGSSGLSGGFLLHRVARLRCGFAFLLSSFHFITLSLNLLLILAGDRFASSSRFLFRTLAPRAIRKLIARGQCDARE